MIITANIDELYMQRAINLAALALGRTSPNPVVGALIVKNEQIIGEGYHKKAGTPHAEVHALNAAGEDSKGATLYVTLEPCSHFGRTPPCADAVIRAGIKRVVVAATDPNPLVAGKGIEKLRRAGIEVDLGILQKEACCLNEAFFKYIKTGIPFVALKTAMSLDGKIAAYTGDSKWITGQAARHYVHQLRNTYDAILVGIGTVLKDDPMLNTRLDEKDIRDPIRIIIDSNLDLPINSNIVRSAHIQKTIVFCSSAAGVQKGKEIESFNIEVIRIDSNSALIPLEKVLKILGDRGLCSLLVEGGGEINSYFIEHQMVDKVFWFIAPKVIGGRQAPSPIGGQGISLMKDALDLKSLEIQRFAQDILITGYFKEWCY